MLDKDIEQVLITAEDIHRRVVELGAQITEDYRGSELLLVGVLKGALPFLVDLARQISLPLEIDVMAVSSYGSGTVSSGVIRLMKDLDATVDGKNLLIIEDIIDTGQTLQYLLQNLAQRQPASLRVCGLLQKQRPRFAEIPCDYLGFQIPDRFVVGYGLDYAQRYRNLPYIGVLRPGIYAPGVERSSGERGPDSHR